MVLFRNFFRMVDVNGGAEFVCDGDELGRRKFVGHKLLLAIELNVMYKSLNSIADL